MLIVFNLTVRLPRRNREDSDKLVVYFLSFIILAKRFSFRVVKLCCNAQKFFPIHCSLNLLLACVTVYNTHAAAHQGYAALIACRHSQKTYIFNIHAISIDSIFCRICFRKAHCNAACRKLLIRLFQLYQCFCRQNVVFPFQIGYVLYCLYELGRIKGCFPLSALFCFECNAVAPCNRCHSPAAAVARCRNHKSVRTGLFLYRLCHSCKVVPVGRLIKRSVIVYKTCIAV